MTDLAPRDKDLPPLPSFSHQRALVAVMAQKSEELVFRAQREPEKISKPTSLRMVGFAAAIHGLLIAIGCAAADAWLLAHLSAAHSTRTIRWSVAGFGIVSALLGVMLVVGGMRMMTTRRSGRRMLLLYSFSSIPLYLAAIAASAYAVDWSPTHFKLLAAVCCLHMAVGLGGILVGLVLACLLLGGTAARWFDKPISLFIPDNSAPQPSGPPRLCISALLCAIFAFSPPPVLMQVFSLMLGVRALGIVRRSGGARYGRAMAIIGTIVSGLILALAGATVATGSASMVLDDAAAQNQFTATSRLKECVVAQKIYQQFKLAPGATSAPCASSLADLIRATRDDYPIEDPQALAAADHGTLGDRAQTYHGYFFKLTTWSDAPAGSPNWIIFAWPVQWLGSTRGVLMLDSTGEIRTFKTLHSEPPNNPTHEMMAK